MTRVAKFLGSFGIAGLILLASCSPVSEAPSQAKKIEPQSSVRSQLSPAQREAGADEPADAARGIAARAPDSLNGATSSSASAPISDRGLLGRLSKSSLFALRLPRLELLGEAWRRSAMSRWYQHPAIAARMEMATSQYGKMIADLEAKAPEAAELLKLLRSVRGEFVFAVENVDPARAIAPNGGLPFSLVALCDAGEQAAELQRAIEPLLVRAASDASSGFQRKSEGWGFELLVGQGRLDVTCAGTCFEARLEPESPAPRERAPIAREDSLLASAIVRSSPDLAQEDAPPCLELYWNFETLWTLAKAFAPAEASRAISRSGLDSIAGLSFVAGLAPEGLSEVLTLHSPGGKDLFSRALCARPLNAELARWIPIDAENTLLFSFDLATLFQDVRAALPPQQLAQMDGGLDMLRSQQGIDLRGDVLENFGPTFAFATKGGLESLSERGALEFVLLIEVQDPAKARRAIEKSGVPLAELKTSSEARLFQGAAVSGDDASTPAPTPTWALGERCLVVASDASLARQSLQAAQGSAGISNADMRAALASGADGLWSISVAKGRSVVRDTVTYGRRTAAGLEMKNRGGAGTLCSGGLIGGTGIMAAVAIPRLLVARLSANEAAAIATLRSVASAQAQVQASGAIDGDRDGVGEYGYFAELAGSMPVRISVAGAPARGVAHTDDLTPPVLSSAFGAVDGTSRVSRSGYVFQVWLPAATVGGSTAGIAEDAGGGKAAGPFPDSDNGEVVWCCYAWPIAAGQTGNRCFFINQEGDLLQTANFGSGAYSGTSGGPSCYAAYSVANDMDSPLGIDGVRANDGNAWGILER